MIDLVKSKLCMFQVDDSFEYVILLTRIYIYYMCVCLLIWNGLFLIVKVDSS